MDRDAVLTILFASVAIVGVILIEDFEESLVERPPLDATQYRLPDEVDGAREMHRELEQQFEPMMEILREREAAGDPPQ